MRKQFHSSLQRLLSLLLALAMLLPNFPVLSFAEETDPDAGTVCGIPAHSHAEACYETAAVVACGQEEGQIHNHSDGCFQATTVVVCGLEEGEGHTHTEDCNESQSQCICPWDEETPHVHAETCFRQDSNLVCTLAEHSHGTGCYPAAPQPRSTAANISNYTADLYVYNNIRYSDADGNNTITYADLLTLSAPSDAPFAHDIFIGAYTAAADDPNKKPMQADINLEFAGLSMGGDVTVNPVYPDEPGAYKTALNVTAESSIGNLTLADNAILEITLTAPLTVGAVMLGKNSRLTVKGNASFALGNVTGSGDLSVANSTVTAAAVSCQNLSVSDGSLTADSIHADNGLSLSQSNINVSGEITAAGSITATNAAIANATLFGVKEAAAPVTMTFTGVTFNNVARVGAADGCTARVYFAAGNSVTAEAASYLQDFTITYQADDITEPSHYRVHSTKLSGEGSTIVSEKKLPAYAKDGYTFLGWKTEADAEPITALQDGLMGNLTLSPATDAMGVNVTMDLMFLPSADNCDDPDSWNQQFDLTSDANTKYSQQSVKVDGTLELPTPQRFGYEFMGWQLKGTSTVLVPGSTVVTLDKLTDTESFTMALEAVWQLDSFPLYWTFSTNIPLESVRVSLDGGTTMCAPQQLAENYPTLWTWDSKDNVLRSTENSKIFYGETLGDYLTRLGKTLDPEVAFQFPVARDARLDDDNPLALGFLNWSTKTPIVVSGSSTFDTGATGFLVKPNGETWDLYQNTTLPLSGVITLTANFGTADYDLAIPDAALSDWTFQIDGASVTPEGGKLSIPNGSEVTMSCTVKSGLTICNWEFIPENASLITPVEQKYDGGTRLYYKFTMPACNVQTNYLTSATKDYINIAKGSITFVKDVDPTGTGINRNGFWYPERLVSGKTENHQLPLLGMTPLCHQDDKGYFYVWDVANQPLYVTSDGVATTNQLTLVSTSKVTFNAINMEVRQAYLDNAVGRRIYGESVEKPRDSSASGSMDPLSKAIREKGGLAPLGNIVLANDGAVSQSFILTFLGEQNHVGSIFSDQYYYSARNSLTIQGSGTASLALGTAFANCSITAQNIVLTAVDTNCDYLLHAITASSSITLSNARVTAPKKELYVKDSSFSVSNLSIVDLGTVVAGSSMGVGAGSKIRVRGDLMVGYNGMSIGSNSIVVIDGNYLTKYFHDTDASTTRGGAGAVFIVKGNRCELGSHYWGGGLLICNELILGRTGGVKGGTVIANQIINLPISQWDIKLNSSEYVFAATDGNTSSNGDNYPFVTYSQGSSTHTTFDFTGGKTYLTGYYPEGKYDPSITVEDTPLKDILSELLDQDGGHNGTAVDEAALKNAIQSTENEYKNNECIVIGNSTYNTDNRSRTVNFSGNAEVYAAGNLTLFNTTNVSGNTNIWCGGTFGSKRDMNISGGTITAKEVGIAYNLITSLEDLTKRWNILTVSGGHINTDQIGTLSNCASDSSRDVCGFAFIDPTCVHPLTSNAVSVEFDEYVNYLLGTAGFENPETNPDSVHIGGNIKNGIITYNAEQTTFTPPAYEGGSGVWKLNSVNGKSVNRVNTDAVLTYEGTPLSTTAYEEDRLILVAVKDTYNITVKTGVNLVADLNTKGQVEQASGTAGQSVTITISDSGYAADKTVVWYTDANGYLRKPADYKVEGNTITFTMPYFDVEVFVAPEGMELDLSKHHVTITADGFHTKLGGTNADQEFHYTGNLTIIQSQSNATEYRIRVLSDVDNLNLSRRFTLKQLNQASTLGEVGLKLENGAKAHFMIHGEVLLYRVEVPELSEIILEAVTRDYNTHQLNITAGNPTNATNDAALGNYYGKAGDITIKNLKLLPRGTQFNIWGRSETKNPDCTVTYIGCSLNITNWYSSSYLAYRVGTVIFQDCDFSMTAASSWSSPIVTNCDNLQIINSNLSYTLIGCTSSSNGTQSLAYGIKNQFTVTDSTVTLTLRNSTESTNYKVYPLSSDDAPVVVLNGNTVYNAEMRTTFNRLVLEGNATFNAGGDSKNGYVFADTIEVKDNATLNANTVLVSGYLTENVSTIEKVQEKLASSSAKLKDGTEGGLFISGGSVNASKVGGDKNSVITVTGGNLNAAQIGTLGYIYGYSFYTPEAHENWVESYAKIPVGATVNISGGTVNVSDYLGGMKATVNISGGQVNLADGATLGMTNSQRDDLNAYYTAEGENIDDKTDNINVNISGGKVEGDSGTINIPYGQLNISGAGTGVKVGNILAHYGDVTIKEATGTYQNGLANVVQKVGVYVSNEMNGQNITISEAANVYAKAVYATALLAKDKACLNVVGNKLFAETVGTAGEGTSIIQGEGNIQKLAQQFSITYILYDDATDPATHDNPTAFTHEPNTTIPIGPAERYGYVFKGWYATKEDAQQMDPDKELTEFHSQEEPVVLHAAWEIKTVQFQVRVIGSKFTDIGVDLNTEKEGLSASYENNILTFDKIVTVPYRSLIRGVGENNLKLHDFDLSAYSCNAISFADGSLTGLIDANTTVSRDVLNYYGEKGSPIILEVSHLIKKNENLTLHLNHTNDRPVKAHFDGYAVGRNSLTGSATVGSTISTAVALMTDGKLNQPEAPGYTFKGWYTSKKPGTEDTPINENYLVTGSGPLDFYALWEANQYKIRFDSKDGKITLAESKPSGDAPETLDAFVYYDTPINGTLTYENDTSAHNLPFAWKLGYKFSHWAVVDGNGTEIERISSQELNQSNFSSIIEAVLEDKAVQEKEEPILTLTAIYDPITVTYHTEGGTFTSSYTEVAGIKHVSGDTYTSHTNGTVVAYGKPLAGYSPKPDADDSQDYNLFGINPINTNFAVVSTKHEYYAQHNTYYSEDNIKDYRFELGKKGYTFKGWVKKNSDEFVGTLPEYEDIELWAVWTPNSYKLELHAQDKTGSTFSDIISNVAPVYDPEKPHTVPVTVGKLIDGTTQSEIGTYWPNRVDSWYAIEKSDSTANKRFLLGFTFDFLDPSAPNGPANSEQQKTYNRYARNITDLINHKTLFTKVETIGDNGAKTEGSIFFLPEAKDYEDPLKDNDTIVSAVPDYPDGSTIPMYAVYRERSVVFIERYVDLDSNTQETVLTSESYLTYSKFANDYRNDAANIAKFKAMGYTFDYWSVNHESNGDRYPTDSSNYESLRTKWIDEATSLGSYDINIYTVYAADVTADIDLVAATIPGAESAAPTEYPIPGSMALKEMVYTVDSITKGLNIVDLSAEDGTTNSQKQAEFEANRLNPAHVEDVAIWVELLDSDQKVQEAFWLKADKATNDVGIAVGAGWTIRMTMYHSRLIPANYAKQSFVLHVGFQILDPEDSSKKIIDENQKITLNTDVIMNATRWTVQYHVNLPTETEEPYRNVLDANGFSGNGDTRTKTDVNWTYGANLQSIVPSVEGFVTDGKWTYSGQEFEHGKPGKIIPSDTGKIDLTSGYTRASYQLTDQTNGACKVSKTGQIPYHEQVTLTPGKTDPAFIWVQYAENAYRLDKLVSHGDLFRAEEKDGSYTFLMSPGNVEILYDDVMELYLGYGSIDINEAGYTYRGETVNWRGNYQILQWPAGTAFEPTANVLTLAGDLSARSIALGKLDITTSDSVSLAAGSNVNLTATDSITAQNIRVPETATLNLTGKDSTSKPSVTLTPESGSAAIGGCKAPSGTLQVKDLALTATMPAGSRASVIGPGTNDAGNCSITIEDCSIQVSEETSLVSGAYSGIWFGGTGATVVVRGSTVSCGTLYDSAKLCDGTSVTFDNCVVGSEKARIAKHPLKGDHIYINSSKMYLDTNGITVLTPGNALHVDNGTGASGSVIDVSGLSAALYENALKLYRADSKVTVYHIRLLDVNNGNLQISATGTTQASTSFEHSGSYRLLDQFDCDNAEVTVTGNADVNIQTEAGCNIKTLDVKANTQITSLGDLQVGSLRIDAAQTLSVRPNEDNSGLVVEDSFGGDGNYVQEGGILSSTTDLTVGGDMNLAGVSVSADGKKLGSHGTTGKVTTVTIDGGSVTAATVGACGAQNDTFTFVELKNSPAITGNLVQDLYRLRYTLEDDQFQKSDGVPVDKNEKKLPTVLRSSTAYANGSAADAKYAPETPDAPKYTGSGDSYFSCWYLLDDGKKVALSKTSVNGIDRIDTLNADMIEHAGTAAADGTRTLDLYAWMAISGTGKIAYGRILNEATATEQNMNIETDGAFTARFDVTGAAPAESVYTFTFGSPIPAGTKLTLSHWHDSQVTYYYCITGQSVTSLREDNFIRMGSATAKADLITGTEAFEDVLQLSADFRGCTATGNTLALKVQLGDTTYPIDEVEYSVFSPAVSSCEATETTVTYSFAPGSDKRLENQNLYLVAEIRNAGNRISAPYDAVMTLDGQPGIWLGGSAVYFSLGSCHEISETKPWELTGLKGGSYSITWYLTAAEGSDEPNVLRTVLASSTVATTVAELPKPELSVTLEEPAGTYVLDAGEEQALLFRYSTNGTVSVILEKQGTLQTFSTVSQNIVADPNGTSVTIPGEAGVYRVRFSLDGFDADSSDWDDVYFTFLVQKSS